MWRSAIYIRLALLSATETLTSLTIRCPQRTFYIPWARTVFLQAISLTSSIYLRFSCAHRHHYRPSTSKPAYLFSNATAAMSSPKYTHTEFDLFAPMEPETSTDHKNGLHRRLSNRQVQLICIGGAIGTSLFIRIGNGLAFGGPASLLIAYIIYSCVLALVSNCLAEMTVEFPVSGGFVRQAGHWCDDALGFMAGWNYLYVKILYVPEE